MTLPKNGYEDALRTVSSEDLLVETNTNRMISHNPFSSSNFVATTSVVLSFLLVTILQIELLVVWIWKRKQELRVLRILGVHQKTLILNVLAMLFKAGRIPYLILVFGLTLLIPFQYLLVFLLYLLGLTVLVLVAAATMISRIPLQKENPKRQKRRPPAASRVITIKEVSRRFLSQQKWSYRMQIFCLVLLQIGFLYFGNRIIDSAHLLRNSFLDYQIEGMSWMEPVSGFCTLHLVPENVWNELREWTDVEVQAEARTLHDRKMSWEKIQNSLLYDPAQQHLASDRHFYVFTHEDGQTDLYSSINLITDQKAVEQLQKEDIEGEVDWENWKQGREAIIYVPKMRMRTSVMDYHNDFGLFPAEDGEIDDSIKPNDLITLEKEGHQYQVRVSGILRDCSPELYRLVPYLYIYGLVMIGNEVDTVQLNLNSIQNKVPVEIRLSKLASENNLMFRNFASDNEWLYRNSQIHLLLNLFSALILFSVLMVILQLSRIIAKEREDDYLNILKKIGLSQKDRKKIVISFHRRLFVRSTVLPIVIALCQRYLLIKKGYIQSLITQNLWLSAVVLLIVLIFVIFLFSPRHSENFI